jgi:serine O-acetyltransferase
MTSPGMQGRIAVAMNGAPQNVVSEPPSPHPSTIAQAIDLVRADAHRYGGSILRLLAVERVFRHIVSLRLNTLLCRKREFGARVARVATLLYWHRARTLGFDISPEAVIGPGLYVDPHPGGVVVHREARLGKNCNLHHGVTIGRKHRGPRTGAPHVGNNVWIGPGAKLVGSITVGDGAVIGPNCVVAEDVAPGAVLAVGHPQVVGAAGSAGYIERPV